MVKNKERGGVEVEVEVNISMHYFGKEVLSIFSLKIMAIIFDFNGCRRLGRERDFY